MEFVSQNIIKLNRELSYLDRFALDFIDVLKNYSKYVIVSGYVSILLGRARASEDIDIIVPKMDFDKFKLFYESLKKNLFYCLNADEPEEIYEYLTKGSAVRFAKKDTIIPNMELKFAKKLLDNLSFNKCISVMLGKREIVISNLELQIAFKEEILKSPKDIEDARHIRKIAEKHLNKSLIKEYKRILNEQIY